MSDSSYIKKSLIIMAVLVLAMLAAACSSNAGKAVKGATTQEDAELQRLEKLARAGDNLAQIALDKAVAHVTVAERVVYTENRDYWFEPQSRNVVIKAAGYRNTHSNIFVSHKKNAVVVEEYFWGGFSPDHGEYRTEISQATVEFVKNDYAPSEFADYFRESAEAWRKFPSYAYANSNRKFLEYFYDPTRIGGVASDYVYGEKESTVTAGRDAYKVTIGPSASYKKKLAQGLKEDYIGRSRIEVFFDKATGLPIRVVRTIDNDMLKYSTAMTLDLGAEVELPVRPSADIMPGRSYRHYRQIFLPSEIEKRGFITLGCSYKGLTGRPAVLESTDTASWIARMSYQKDRDGFIVLQAKQAQYAGAKEEFLSYINGISEEVTVTEHSMNMRPGDIVDTITIPKPRVERLKIAGADAVLYSYVGLLALEIQVGDKILFIRDFSARRDDFSLNRAMLVEMATDLVKEKR